MSSPTSAASAEDAFLHSPVNETRFSLLKAGFALSALAYFFSCFGDLGRWFGPEGLINAPRMGAFLKAADLQDQAKWFVSPLWWTDSVWVHQAVLVIGMLVAACILIDRAPRGSLWILWLLCVSVANRYVTLSGLAESWLSLSLAVLAIAGSFTPSPWRRSFGLSLMLWQFTLLGCITCASMWAGDVWRNGLGAIALAEPSSLKSFDWSNSLLTSTIIHDSVTIFLVAAIPLGLWLAWKRERQKWGVGLLVSWAVLIAMLGSHWIYATLFACNACAFLCLDTSLRQDTGHLQDDGHLQDTGAEQGPAGGGQEVKRRKPRK